MINLKIVFFSILISSTIALAQNAGTLDPFFNSNGFLDLNPGDLGTNNSYFIGSHRYADGTIMAAGYATASSGQSLFFMKFNASGIPDNSFGNVGVVKEVTDVYGYSYSKFKVSGLGKMFLSDGMLLYSFNSDGTINSSFGINGKVNSDFSSVSAVHNTDYGYSLKNFCINSDNSIYVNYGYYDNGDKNFIIKLNASGVPISSFGTNSIKELPFEKINNIMETSDGKIIVSGQNANKFLVARLTSNGSFDSNFNSSGYKEFDNGISISGELFDILVDANNKILLRGQSSSNTVVVRLNEDGSFDTSLDGDGIKSESFFGKTLNLDINGKIVVGGFDTEITLDGTISKMAVYRFNSNGSLDNAFDSDGKFVLSTGSTEGDVYSTEIDGDKICLIGWGVYDKSNDATVLKLTNTGMLDIGFDSDGILSTKQGKGYLKSKRVRETSDGKYYVLTEVNRSRKSESRITRYNSNGTVDLAFSGDGYVTIDAGVLDFNFDLNQKIVYAGYIMNFGYRFFMAGRLNADGTTDLTFNTTGQGTYSLANSYAAGIRCHSDGSILVTGQDQSSYGYVVMLNTDGTLKTTFNGSGKKTFSANVLLSQVLFPSDGKIVLAGFSANTPSNFIIKINSTGALDFSFDSDGIAEYSNGVASEIKMDTWNNLYIVSADFQGVYSSYLNKIKYNDGSLDVSFGSSGSKILIQDYFVYDFNFDSDSNLVCTGTSMNATNYGALFQMRMIKDGGLDAMFDQDGIKIYPSIVSERVNDVLITINGKILVLGDSGNEGFMARFDNGDDLTESIMQHRNMTDLISVYPNPAEEFITFNAQQKTLHNIQILNSYGVLVWEGTDTTISVSEFKSGIYSVRLFVDRDVYASTLIINHTK